METMYDRIRQLRIEHQMSQDDLAHALGYKDRSMITKIESGKVDISQKKIIAFAKALDTTPRYLMDGNQKEDPNEKIVRMISTLSDENKEELRNYLLYLISKQKRNG